MSNKSKSPKISNRLLRFFFKLKKFGEQYIELNPEKFAKKVFETFPKIETGLVFNARYNRPTSDKLLKSFKK